MKKIFLNAYLDLNIGDDLMVRYIVGNFPEFEFGIYCKDDKFKLPFSQLNNIVFLNKETKKKYMKESDYCLFLGGSIYQVKNLRLLLSFIKRYIELRKYNSEGKKIITLGANLGPFYNSFSRYIVHEILYLHDLIIVRDKPSYDSIKKKNNLHLATDIVYEASSEFHPASDVFTQEIAGISIYRSLDQSFNNDSLKRSYINYIHNTLSNNKFKKVRLFTFNSGYENDTEMADSIMNEVNDERVSLVRYEGNINDFLQSFSECTQMVATRFHSAILSDIFNIPFYALAYSNKMTDYLSGKTSIVPLNLNGNEINLVEYCEERNLIRLETKVTKSIYLDALRDILYEVD